MTKKQTEQEKLSKKQRRDRQASIAELWYKGYTKTGILDMVGCTEKELGAHLKMIKLRLTPQTIKILEYRRNKCLNKISLVQSTAWSIIKDTINENMKLTALRVITSSQELEAKVEGVTQEKFVISPEKEATGLLRQIKDLEEKSRAGGNGQKEEKPIAETEEVPLFLADKP